MGEKVSCTMNNGTNAANNSGCTLRFVGSTIDAQVKDAMMHHSNSIKKEWGKDFDFVQRRITLAVAQLKQFLNQDIWAERLANVLSSILNPGVLPPNDRQQFLISGLKSDSPYREAILFNLNRYDESQRANTSDPCPGARNPPNKFKGAKNNKEGELGQPGHVRDQAIKKFEIAYGKLPEDDRAQFCLHDLMHAFSLPTSDLNYMSNQDITELTAEMMKNTDPACSKNKPVFSKPGQTVRTSRPRLFGIRRDERMNFYKFGKGRLEAWLQKLQPVDTEQLADLDWYKSFIEKIGVNQESGALTSDSDIYFKCASIVSTAFKVSRDLLQSMNVSLNDVYIVYMPTAPNLSGNKKAMNAPKRKGNVTPYNVFTSTVQVGAGENQMVKAGQLWPSSFMNIKAAQYDRVRTEQVMSEFRQSHPDNANPTDQSTDPSTDSPTVELQKGESNKGNTSVAENPPELPNPCIKREPSPEQLPYCSKNVTSKPEKRPFDYLKTVEFLELEHKMLENQQEQLENQQEQLKTKQLVLENQMKRLKAEQDADVM